MFYGLCAAEDCGAETPDPTMQGTTSSSTGEPTSTSSSTSGDEQSETMPDVGSDETASPESSSSSSSSGGDSTDTSVAVDCDNLPQPPFTITPLGNVFPQRFAGVGSEDIAMTGNGTFVGESGDVLLESDAEGNTSEYFSDIASPLFGLRFNSDGELLGVNSGSENVDIFSGGLQDVYATMGMVMGNGLYPDNEGNAWVSDFGGNAIYRIDSTQTVHPVTDLSTQPNGIFFDENRRILFWTRYGTSELHSFPIDDDYEAGADALVVNLAGQTDGITMDVCGHIYAVDQAGGGSCRIDRVHLTEDGELAPEGVVEIAGGGDIGTGCSNAQFGYGFGDDNDRSLFVTAISGDIYIVDVGIEGYPIP
jgi:hypothetical protein